MSTMSTGFSTTIYQSFYTLSHSITSSKCSPATYSGDAILSTRKKNEKEIEDDKEEEEEAVCNAHSTG